jgi:hypothetical protein
MEDSAYDLDVAQSVLSDMRGITSKKIEEESDPEKKLKLRQELDMIIYEMYALHSSEDAQHSIMDKAFRLYGPILKTYYANS